MGNDPRLFPIAVFAVGLGLLLLGGVNALLARRSPRGGLALGALACAGGAGPVLLWLPDPSGRWAVVLALTAAGLAAVALGSTWLPRLVAAGLCLGSRPRARWAGLAGLGLALLAAAAADVTAIDDRLGDRDPRWLNADRLPPKIRPAPVPARTDRGRPVPLFEPVEPRDRAYLDENEHRLLGDWTAQARLIRVRPADDACNCHGWVFTAGRYWLRGDAVERILADNGYAPVTAPRPGDLAVYRRDGPVIHTALVRAANDGRPVLVEGKWGWMGVFLHPVQD